MKKLLPLFLFLSVQTCSAMKQKKLIELKDGTFLEKTGALEVYESIKSLFENHDRIIFYDLVHSCKNPDHKPFLEKSKKVLEELKLDSTNDTVKKIMKNVLENQELVVRIFYPFKKNKE